MPGWVRPCNIRKKHHVAPGVVHGHDGPCGLWWTSVEDEAWGTKMHLTPTWETVSRCYVLRYKVRGMCVLPDVRTGYSLQSCTNPSPTTVFRELFFSKLQIVCMLSFFVGINSTLSTYSKSRSLLDAGESQKVCLMKSIWFPFEKTRFHWNEWQNSHWFHVGWVLFWSHQTVWLSLFDLLIESWGSVNAVVFPTFGYVENITRTSFYEVCCTVFLDLGHVSKNEFLCVSSRGKH